MKTPKLNKGQKELLEVLTSGATKAVKKSGLLAGKVTAEFVTSKPKRIDFKAECIWLHTELDKWRKIAAWMGECHAANLHEAELSSVSQERRDRFKSIMLSAANYMEQVRPPDLGFRDHHSGHQQVLVAIARLRDHARRIPLKTKKTKQ